MKVLKKMWSFLKKSWQWILALLAFVAGIIVARPKEKRYPTSGTETELKRKKEQQEKLEKELEQLKREEEQIKDKRYFDSAEDAAEYLDEILRRRRGQ